jgi:hypothetical protein
LWTTHWTGDSAVDVSDLLKLLAAYGTNADGDINGDGETSVTDLLQLLGVYGASCQGGAAAAGGIPERQSDQQCYTTEDNRLAADSSHRNDNPIFEGGGFHGVFTLQDCADLCWHTQTLDSHGRRCVAFEWSDGGDEQSDETTRNCAMAWSCTHTRYWGGGSVFVLDGPVSCTSDSFACADNWDGVSGR